MLHNLQKMVKYAILFTVNPISPLMSFAELLKEPTYATINKMEIILARILVGIFTLRRKRKVRRHIHLVTSDTSNFFVHLDDSFWNLEKHSVM